MAKEQREEVRAERADRLEAALQKGGEAAYLKQLKKETKMFAKEELARRKDAETARVKAAEEAAEDGVGEGGDGNDTKRQSVVAPAGAELDELMRQEVNGDDARAANQVVDVVRFIEAFLDAEKMDLAGVAAYLDSDAPKGTLESLFGEIPKKAGSVLNSKFDIELPFNG